MDFFLMAVALGYLQTGTNHLNRDLTGGALNRPFYASAAGSKLPGYAFTLLLWPVLRFMRRAPGIPATRTLAFASIEWGFCTVLSAASMAARRRAVRRRTARTGRIGPRYSADGDGRRRRHRRRPVGHPMSEYQLD